MTSWSGNYYDPYMEDTMKKPNPGSDEAIKQGCICAVLDNGHGSEELGRVRGFWITQGCPVHAPTDQEDKHVEDNS